MPPKSNKGKSRPHPYKGNRKSARQAELAEQVQVQATETQVRHEESGQEPTPSTSSGVTHGDGTSGTTSQEVINIPGPAAAQTQVSGEPPVSRQEFQELRDNLASIKDFMSSFFANSSQNTNQSPTQQVPQSTSVTGSHIPVLITPPHNAQQLARPVMANQAVDQVVQQAVSQHVQAVTHDLVVGSPSFDKPSLQIDRKVSTKIMNEIWENKYVELIDLLDKKEDTAMPLNLVINESGEQHWVPVRSTKEISSIGQWSRAFDIYLCIYSRKYPEQTHNLLAYASKVKDLAYDNGDYVRYDREFRISRARYNIPWETPDLELWYKCSQAGLKSQLEKVTNLVKNQDQSFRSNNNTNDTTSQNNKPKLKHPTGACFNYHNKGRCSRANCRFSHRCYASGCNQEHPASTCPIINKSDSTTLPQASAGNSSNRPTASNTNKTS